MLQQEMLHTAERFLLTHNQANHKEAFDEYFSQDVVIHEYVAGFRAAMPDIRNTVEDIFASENKVAIRWSGHGTHTRADLMGIPAGGNKVTAHGMYILRFVNGKIAEVWDNWDNLNILGQLKGKG